MYVKKGRTTETHATFYVHKTQLNHFEWLKKNIKYKQSYSVRLKYTTCYCCEGAGQIFSIEHKIGFRYQQLISY